LLQSETLFYNNVDKLLAGGLIEVCLPAPYVEYPEPTARSSVDFRYDFIFTELTGTGHVVKSTFDS